MRDELGRRRRTPYVLQIKWTGLGCGLGRLEGFLREGAAVESADIRDNNVEKFWAALWGSVVGDALGVPVEFRLRSDLSADPVTGMRAFGSHRQPAGTWSDDTSMTLAALDVWGRTGTLDPGECLEAWRRWLRDNEYTPHGSTFDVGGACEAAITRFEHGTDPRQCGGTGLRDNGNGALMRMLPVIAIAAGSGLFGEAHSAELRGLVTEHAGLTHAHPISLVGCLLYVHAALALWQGATPPQAYRAMLAVDLEGFPGEALAPYSLLLSGDLGTAGEEEIESSGYVAHTLTAALWTLLTAQDYPTTVLKAVNLGLDTDTTGAVAGLLAGLTYGRDAIPGEWLEGLANQDLITKIATAAVARF